MQRLYLPGSRLQQDDGEDAKDPLTVAYIVRLSCVGGRGQENAAASEGAVFIRCEQQDQTGYELG
jgi:hypothetical protein